MAAFAIVVNNSYSPYFWLEGHCIDAIAHHRHDISDELWAMSEPLFTDRNGKRGRPAGDNRRAFSMPSCGSCAQEHPGVIFLQTMDTGTVFL